MAISLALNAYHVLGLDASATTRQALRRSNEILQLLELDESPEFDFDLCPATEFRDAEAVKEATRKLQNPRQRLSEYFFWFDASDLPHDALDALHAKDFESIASICSRESQSGPTERLLRQAALASLLSMGGDCQRAIAALKVWKVVLESDTFWSAFAKNYRFEGQVAASDDLIATFRGRATGLLSDLYFSMCKSSADPSLVTLFTTVFSKAEGELRQNVLSPIIENINAAITGLSVIETGETARITSITLSAIRTQIEKIQEALNNLVVAALVDDSEVTLIRDSSAIELRRIVLDLHNHHSEYGIALKLLEIATSIAGTEGLKDQLRQEAHQVGEAVENERENSVSIVVPGTFGGGTLVFNNDAVTYNRVRLRYQDITSVSYSASNQTIWSQSYNFDLRGPQNSISVRFGTTFYLGNNSKRDAWLKMVSIISHVIEPLVVKRLLRQLLVEERSLIIGDVTFTRRGFSKRKTFGGDLSVEWGPDVYLPKLSEGNVVIWYDKKGKVADFSTIPLSTANAAIVPELVKAIVAEVCRDE